MKSEVLQRVYMRAEAKTGGHFQRWRSRKKRGIRSCGVRDVPEQKCARKKAENARATNRHAWAWTYAAATSKYPRIYICISAVAKICSSRLEISRFNIAAKKGYAVCRLGFIIWLGLIAKNIVYGVSSRRMEADSSANLRMKGYLGSYRDRIKNARSSVFNTIPG